MAFNDTEIEIKLSMDEDAFGRVREKLKEIAEFVKETRQEDEYFTPVHRNFVEPEFPFEWLSIRRRGDKSILNYKHFYPENTETFTHCDEFESEIKDSERLKRMLSLLNFRTLVTVEKSREVFMYKDEFEVSLDKVKDLGHFIEIEAAKDFGGVDATRERLFEFARNLGIDVKNSNKRGYPFMLMQKKGLIKRI